MDLNNRVSGVTDVRACAVARPGDYRRSAGDPGLELLFLLELAGHVFGLAPRGELADADAEDRGRSGRRRHHVGRVAFGAQTLRNRFGVAADVEGCDLHGEAGAGRFGRPLAPPRAIRLARAPAVPFAAAPLAQPSALAALLFPESPSNAPGPPQVSRGG